MIKEEYSPFKIVHHPKKNAELREGRQPTPLQIQIIPSNVCNQRCTFCAYHIERLSFQRTVQQTGKLVEVAV